MIKEYENYLRSVRGYSENTIIAYIKDIREFVVYMKAHTEGARWSNIGLKEIDGYISYQAKRGLKATTTNRQLASISSIYNYMKREGMPVENPCRYESRRKTGKHLPNVIPSEDVAAAYERSHGVTKLLIGILATTGIRIQELLSLTWEDINTTTGVIRINGKGSKQRIVYTNPSVLKELRKVEDVSKPSGRMFYIDQREARTMIYEAMRHISKANQLSPHAIRHTFATELAGNGTNVTTIAKILGHEDIRTTQKYIDMTQLSTKEAMQNASIIN